MRTEKAFRNSITSIGTYLLILVLGLVTRRLMLQEFETELVGYDALLSNIFGIVAIADFGSDGLFIYRFYGAFAQNDTRKISKLLGMYRTLCAIIGIGIAVALVVVFFLLPSIFAGKVTMWGYFRLMFLLYALSNVIAYFLNYRRSLFVAAQKEYRVIWVETACRIALLAAKAILLFAAPDFLIYLILTCVSGILSQVLVVFLSRREFPDIVPVKASFADYKAEGFFSDIKNLYLTKFYYTVNMSTDSLLIAFLANALSVTLYSNYILIGGSVITIVFKLIAPLGASVAEAVNTESKEDLLGLYRMLDMICFFVASVVFSGFVVVFQSAIPVFFGEQFLLPFSFVLAYGFYAYVYVKLESVSLFRGSFGDFQVSRRYDGYSMVCNLAVSFLLFQWLGIAGITLGTAVSLLVIWHGRFQVVESHLFHRRISALWGRELLQFSLAAAQTLIAWLLTRSLPVSVAGMLLRCVIAVAVPSVINLAIFARTEAFATLLAKLKALLESKRCF